MSRLRVHAAFAILVLDRFLLHNISKRLYSEVVSGTSSGQEPKTRTLTKTVCQLVSGIPN